VGSYYYLMAQLPYLIYEQKPPMSSSEFKDLAKSLLKSNDAALFENLSLTCSEKTDCDFINKWQEWDKIMRLNLAKQRVIKLKLDRPVTEPQSIHLDAAAVASKAVDESSPLDAEIMLDKARWHAIEELAGNDYFSRNTVYAYYLKLLLLERRQIFNAEKGFAEYKSLYASIADSVQSAGESL